MPDDSKKDDPFDLDRFVTAQQGVYRQVEAEMRAGRKTSHWMWFVFPQIAGLGSSAMARRYAITSRAEAVAYLAHPLLGSRLRSLVALVLNHRGKSAHAIFGSPDDVKFRSCLTLFEAVAPDDPVFRQALDVFFAGNRDPATLNLI